jgi:hypothetical protein
MANKNFALSEAAFDIGQATAAVVSWCVLSFSDLNTSAAAGQVAGKIEKGCSIYEAVISKVIGYDEELVMIYVSKAII